MRVALIDDGVVPQVVPRLPARNDLCVLEDGTIRQRRQDEPVLTDHGTTSAQILHMYAPEAEICSLRIFSSPKLRASVGQLAAALEWCWREKIPLIHLSLGTTLSSDYELLCPILARLIRGNQMVVAAHSNRDAYTVPACLMGVLGVSADPQMSGYQYAVQDAAGPEQVQITASSRHALTSPTGRVYETQVTNSYAAPVVTAAVHELLRKSPPLSLTVAEVYEKLAGRQVDISRSRPDFITEAIVYHPSAAPVCQEDLFFTVRAVAHTAAQWRQALREHPGIPTVLLPPATGEGMDAVLDWLHEKQCPGLLCAGPFPAKSGLPPVLLWEEGCRKSFPEYQFPADCASIAITPASQTALHLAKTLQRKFQADGYGCTVVSDLPAAYLYGAAYLYRDESGTPRISTWARHTQTDLWIFCTERKPDCDQSIQIKASGVLILGETETEISQELAKEEVDELYDFLLQS